MSQEKEERNREFVKAWKEEGLSDKKLGERFTLSKFGVKSLKGRLRKKDPSLYQKPESKITVKPEKKITRKPENQKRIKVTFQLPENLFIQVKIKAARERRGISEVVKEIFQEYLG